MQLHPENKLLDYYEYFAIIGPKLAEEMWLVTHILII